MEVKATPEEPHGAVDCETKKNMQKNPEEPRPALFWSKIDVISAKVYDFGAVHHKLHTLILMDTSPRLEKLIFDDLFFKSFKKMKI